MRVFQTVGVVATVAAAIAVLPASVAFAGSAFSPPPVPPPPGSPMPSASSSIHPQYVVGGGGCTPNQQWPHLSSHYPGNVDTKATLACSAPVSYMAVTTYLWRDRWWGWQELDQRTIQANNVSRVGPVTAIWYCRGTGTYTYLGQAGYTAQDAGSPASSLNTQTPAQTLTC